MALPIVRSIRVYTLERDSITVSWEIEPTLLDLSQYIVELWRSESRLGPYTQVSLSMNASDVYEMQDRGVNLYSNWREFYYQVRIVSGADSSEYLEFGSTPHRQVLEGKAPGGVIMEAPPDIYAMESIRRFDLTMREFAGRRVLALVQKTWGQRCTNCWDELKRRRKKSECLTCFDSGIAGGYFSPMETWVAKPPGKVSVQLTSLFELQIDDRILWVSSRPRLKPRDLVIDKEGNRYRVLAVKRSEKGWALTRQTVQVRRITKDQIEYSVPIRQEDWDVTNLTAGAVREHIRATSMASYQDAIRRLGVSTDTLYPEKSEFATNVESSNSPTD